MRNYQTAPSRYRISACKPRAGTLEGGMTKMDTFSKRIVAFETPDDYEEWKKTYWSDENIAYMNYVTDMEKKYGKNFETVLNSMTDKEYEK